jgi:hypothetical protein
MWFSSFGEARRPASAKCYGGPPKLSEGGSFSEGGSACGAEAAALIAISHGALQR